MEIPQGFNTASSSNNKDLLSRPQRVCKLLKSLYGLKQASRQWNITLTQALSSNGYEQSNTYYSLFTKGEGSKRVYHLVYMDDFLSTGSATCLIEELKAALHSNFKLKDLVGHFRYFLDLELVQS